MQDLQPLIKNLMGFAQKRLGFERPPKLFLKQDAENAKNMLGKTAFYDPQAESITLFVSSRHPKDILRSLAHELVHHTQNLRGDLSPEKCGEMGMGYAQNNAHLREMEREAYEEGNLCFRDWEDGYKTQLQQEQKVKSLKESKTMTVKISKDELKDLILKVLKEQKSKRTEEEDFSVEDVMDDPMDLPMARPEFGAQEREYLTPEPYFNIYDYIKDPSAYHKRKRKEDEEIMKGMTTGLDVDVKDEPGTRVASMGLQGLEEPADKLDTADTEFGTTIEVPKKKMILQNKKRKQKILNKRTGLDMEKVQALVGARQTGKYDRQTYNAIRALQKKLFPGKENSDQWDGLFGPTTRREFRSYVKRIADKQRQKSKKPSEKPSDKDELGVPMRQIQSPITRGAGRLYDTTNESVELNEGSKPKAADKKKEDVKAAMKKKAKDAGLADALKGAAELAKEAGCGDHSAKRDDEVVLDEMGMCEVCMKTPCGCPSMEEGKMGVTRTGKQCKCGTPGCGGCESMEEAAASTKMYDDDPALKGDQDELPDHLQKAIIDKEDKKSTDESRVYTPEKEKALYESRYNVRNDAIFDTLKKLWTK